MYIEPGILISVLVLLLLIFALAAIWMLGRRRSSATATQGSNDTENKSSNTARYSRLVLGEVENPLVAIEPLDLGASLEGRARHLPVNERKLAPLQAIFSHTPALTQSALATISKTYTIRMSPEAAKRVADGSWEMMKAAGGGWRGVLVDANGKKIAEHVSLVSSGASKAVAVATIFQCLAIVTAQYYLPQINRRLLQIERGINDLREHLEAHDRAVLVTGLKHLRSMSSVLEGYDLEEADLQANLIGLDDMDRGCSRVLEVNRDHMNRYRSDFDQLDLSGVLKPDFDSAVSKSEQYEKAALVCLQAVYVRSLAAQFRCITPSGYRVSYADNTLRELAEDLTMLRQEYENFSKRFEERVENEAKATLDFDDVKELFGNTDTLENHRQKIIEEERDRHQSVLSMRDELEIVVKNASAQAARQLSTDSEPLTLVVRLNDQNEIEELSELTA